MWKEITKVFQFTGCEKITKVFQFTGYEKKKTLTNMITNGREKSRHVVIYFDVLRMKKIYSNSMRVVPK